MGFKCGIVGLPNVGKSTIFNALTAQQAASENYPFCTIDPNVGIVEVPDPRMAQIASKITAQKVIPASIQFVDIAGLVKGASKGEGLGNQFLAHIRSTDAIAHVVRCFASDDVTHVEGHVDPVRDIEIINTELIFADHETVTSALTRYQKLVKAGNKEVLAIIRMIEALGSHLESLKPARTFDMAPFLEEHTEEVENAYRDLHLISSKQTVYVCNIGEDDLANLGDNDDAPNAFVEKVKAFAEGEGAAHVVVCGALEQELKALSDEDQLEMLSSYGLTESTLARLIRKGYEILGLQTYFTAGEKEIRAWTIHIGDSAPDAAGKIHTDFKRGFICAEVYTVPDLIDAGGKAELKAKGRIRIEGKDYIVKDGDVMEFRFNV